MISRLDETKKPHREHVVEVSWPNLPDDTALGILEDLTEGILHLKKLTDEGPQVKRRRVEQDSNEVEYVVTHTVWGGRRNVKRKLQSREFFIAY